MSSFTDSKVLEDSWQNTWKSFESVELTHSSTHYLLAIHTLLKDKGYARATDISRYLEISRSSVSITLQKLMQKGYIVEDENKFVQLTDAGENYVESVITKRRMLILFFTQILGLSSDIAELDACKIEHLLSRETGEKLIMLINYMLSGHPDVKRFKDGFEQFTMTCSSTEDCTVCENKCYFHELFNDSFTMKSLMHHKE